MTIYLMEGTAANDTLTGTGVNDVLLGGGGPDWLNAGAGNDYLDAGLGANHIDAGAGDDIIAMDAAGPGQMDNMLDGGTGWDTLVLTGAQADYDVQVIGTNTYVTNLTTFQRTTMINVEHIQFSDADTFTTPAPAGLIFGTAGADTLTGTAAADTIYGSGGNDSLIGGDGADYLDAGTGTNRIDAGAGDDIIVGGTADRMVGGMPSNGIDGGAGFDTVSFVGASTNYHIVQIAGATVEVTNLTTGSRDVMINVEQLDFSDGVVVALAPPPVPVNSAPVVSGPVTGTVAEGAAVTSFSALANATDADVADVLSVTNLPVTLPAGVTFDAASQSFVVDATDPAYDALGLGQSLVLNVAYDVTDGTHITAASAAITITGTNDAAVVGGVVTGAVTEDTTLTTSGQMTVADADANQSAFVTITAPLAGVYGALVMDATGAWSYTLNNAAAAVQALNTGTVVTDTFAVTTIDGTTTNLVVSVNGLNEAPVGSIVGTAGADKLNGTAGNDQMLGLDGNDKLSGNGGNDMLDGGLGSDNLAGGAGNDMVLYDGADIKEDGGAGADTLVISAAATVNLSVSDHVIGDAGQTKGFENVDASASAGSVVLKGSNAANILIGGSGNDVITGGKGADVLTGNGGADSFVFVALTDSKGAGRDTITDFQTGVDHIDLSLIDAITGGANDAFTFVGAAAFTAAGQVRYDATTGLLEANVNGNLAADFQVAFSGTPVLTATDFIL